MKSHSHTNIDVADLAWSPEQAYLASCGFDSKIFIWDGATFGRFNSLVLTLDRIIMIESHSAFVKGVTWDPAGNYFATQVSGIIIDLI